MSAWISGVLQSMLDFSRVLNASISAGWLILAVLLLRFLLKKAPRWISVMLWGIVALRLLMPFSIESVFSLLPSAETVSGELLQAGPVPGAAPAYLEIVSNPSYGTGVTMELYRSISSFQWDLLAWTFLWLIGMGVMAVYAAVSYWRLRRSVRTAVVLRDNLFQCETVRSPFVLGLIKPKIYLPYQMEARDLGHVIAHEQAHIRCKDHWWKPLGFLLLTIHWFNPLMWLAYVLLCRDIELACDERVIRELGNEQRADYSQALVACSIGRRSVTACPLAFGEIGVKTRVKSVLHYRKPTVWLLLLAVLLCVALAVCFLTNPVDREPDLSFLNYENAGSLVMDREEVVAIYCPASDSSIQIGAATGSDLAKQLDRWVWKPCNPPREPLPSPGSVEFVIEDDYRITVHQKQPGALRQYAVVEFQGEVRYYRIDQSDYPDAVALVHTPGVQDNVGASVTKWFDYLDDPSGMPSELTTELPEYPGVLFRFTRNQIIASVPYNDAGGAVTLIEGMPIWNAYFTDLTGDGLPEICATYTYGSGIIDSRIVIRDYAKGASYELSDRGYHDFTLWLNENDGALYVNKRVHPNEELVSSGRLVFQDDCIQIEELLQSASEFNKYYLTIGAEGVTDIEISLPHASGGCQNADGTSFRLGEQIWLEPLDGISDLRGLQISARNEAGRIVWLFSVPEGDTNRDFISVSQDGWTISCASFES